MVLMKKILVVLLVTGNGLLVTGHAETARLSDFVSPAQYNIMYPNYNNKMRVALNPGVTPSQSLSQINAVVKTGDMSPNARRVVPRRASAGRAAVVNTPTTLARSGMTTATANFQGLSNVVPTRGVRARATGRTATPAVARQTTDVSISTSRCLADYTACMNDYCERPNTEYNRCYCSPKLAQIDSTYQPAINQLIIKILHLRNGADIYTQAEMDEYWQDKIGQYTGDNSWADLDNALDIDWADTESRVRGQNAFITGHEYCIQHLRACAPMSSNLRDAYRSDIARDCASYENGLNRIKTTAESIVAAYED